MQKPRTTLFMLMSFDGKISTGIGKGLDFDKDLPNIKGIKEGLNQYYELEQKTDIVSFNSGKVMAKIGVNTPKNPIKNIKQVSFVLVDNKSHLNKQGIINLTNNLKRLYLVTTNNNHPAYKLNLENLDIIKYQKKVDFKNLFLKLKDKYSIKRMTIQSGGTLNSKLIRDGLINRVSIVIAPCLIGGKKTSTIMDGDSLKDKTELKHIKSLKLLKVNKLKNSYLQLTYKINN